MRALWCVVMVLVAGVAFGADAIEQKGKIESVTLYRGQALVARIVPVDAAAGSVQVVVTDLPEAVIGGSLNASAGKGVEVRAVRYRTREVGEAPEAEVRKIDAAMEDVQKKMRANAQQQQVVSQQQAYLNNLQGFVAPTAQTELTKGVLNAETLDKLTTTMFARRQELSTKMFELTEQQRDLQKEQRQLEIKRSEITTSHTKMAREAVLFLDKTDAVAVEIRLSYLVGRTSWAPAYNLRSAGDMKKVELEYQAVASQVSGEDWENVTLTLSTATPQLVAEGPNLMPLTLSLGKIVLDNKQADQAANGLDYDYEKAAQGNYDRRNKALDDMNATKDFSLQLRAQAVMNSVADQQQAMEMKISGTDIGLIRQLARQGSGLSVTYKLPGKVSVASRNDSQMVRIARTEMPAEYYYVATPLLAEQVYRYALVTNNSAMSLLEGQGNVYVNGDFAGSINVPMIAEGEQVRLGFGSNPQLRTWRELVAREDDSSSSTQRVTYHYRLVLENFSNEPVKIRLADRVPVGTKDLDVTMIKMKPALSEDPQYKQRFAPRGILRWDLEVPAHAAGDKATVVEYAYRVRFDKDLVVVVPTAPAQPAPAAENELRDMMKSKF